MSVITTAKVLVLVYRARVRFSRESICERSLERESERSERLAWRAEGDYRT